MSLPKLPRDWVRPSCGQTEHQGVAIVFSKPPTATDQLRRKQSEASDSCLTTARLTRSSYRAANSYGCCRCRDAKRSQSGGVRSGTLAQIPGRFGMETLLVG